MEAIKMPLEKGNSNNDPERIVLHAMTEWIFYEGEYLHAYHLLRKLGLSAHALVTPSGQIIRCRHDEQGAYHAKGHNTNTLGVEFLVPGLNSYDEFLEKIKHPSLTTEAFDEGTRLVRGWMSKWDIEKQDVVEHSQIDPTRKHDPGRGFPLSTFLGSL